MEELGNSMPLAEGMVDSEQDTKLSPLSDVCLNCGTPLVGKFCSECGQKNIPRRQTLGELLENFLGSFFSYESKFFRTIKYLLFNPGFLVLEYNAGRRESYYHPARMYVFISFIYFLLFFSLPDNEDGNSVVQNDKVIVNDSTDNFNFQLTSESYETRKEYDSVQATLSEEKRDGWIVRGLQYRTLDLKKEYENNNKQLGRDLANSFSANTPKVLFFLLPVFALLMKLLYLRRNFFYSEHLVLSIYYYNFIFAIGIITLLLQLIPWMSWVSIVTFFVIGLYLLVAMKKVYNQRWGKTVLKFFLLLLSFSVCVAVGLFLNLIFTLLII